MSFKIGGIHRRLSVRRLGILILVLLLTSYGTVFGWDLWKEDQAVAAHKSWFASYVDVTSTPTYDFEQLGATSTPNVVLSFIVSDKTDPCTPAWGSVYKMNEAQAAIDLDRRIARLRQQKGDIVVSFGGLLNDELAVKCKDHDKLYKAYKSVIDKYELSVIDLDLENKGLTDKEALKRRADVISKLQKNQRAKGKSLAVWLTLPVAPSGLTQDGTDAIAYMLSSGVDLAGVNVMTMDYGESKSPNDSMSTASKKALTETHRQLGVLYKKAGINLGSKKLWKKIGATPMIGQNDVKNEIFSLKDAEELNKFAISRGIGRMSMWSANRDLPCGENYVDWKVVSDSCSGVSEDRMSFSQALSLGFEGNIRASASLVTKEDKDIKPLKDDPAKSPYQIWKKEGAYLQGTKVVWHQNVYEAKWWTQGDVPDNPVLQAWETPWKLIGPVLPGEKPVKQLTLPQGTYPEWSGTAEYEAGARVLFNGTPYQAKWWTQGDSPAASTSSADSSPWVPLTQEQVNEVLRQGTAKETQNVQTQEATARPIANPSSPTHTPTTSQTAAPL
jgi:chitinase